MPRLGGDKGTFHKKGNGRTMKYCKPAVAILASATHAIQLTQKGGVVFENTILKLSINAYEADE